MDKTPQQLDPKLKEAYDRVMGTVIAPKTAQTPPQQTTAASPSQPQPTSHTPPTLTPQEKPELDKKKKGISPVIIIIGAIVLLVAYALIWIKIFNVQLF